MSDFKATFRRRVLLTNEVFASARPRKNTGPASVVGIGTTMLWHFASVVRPAQVIAVDRSYSVYIQNRVNVALLGFCADERELEARWLSRGPAGYDRGLLADTLSRIRFEDARAQATASELLWRHAYLGETLTYSGPTLGETLRDPTHPWRDHEAFLTLQRLARDGAITLHHADVRDAECLAAIARACRETPCAWLYFSNVADYVLPDAALGERLAAIPRTDDAEAWIAVMDQAVANDRFVLQSLPYAAFLDRCMPRRARDLEAQWRSFDASTLLPLEMQRDLLFEALVDHAGGLTEDRLTRVRTLELAPAEWLRVAALTSRRDLAPAGDDGALADRLAATPNAAIVRRALADPTLRAKAIPLASLEDLRGADDELAAKRRLNLGEDPGGPVSYAPGDDPARWPISAIERLLSGGADASDGMWPEPVIAVMRRDRTLLLERARVPAHVRVFLERLGDDRSVDERLAALLADPPEAIADADELALRLGLYD